MKKTPSTILLMGTLYGFAFLLNFPWESLHAAFLYVGHDLNAQRFVPMMIYVSVGDGMVVLFLSLAFATFFRDKRWFVGAGSRMVFFWLACLSSSFIIETLNVSLWHRWSYNELMPTILGAGISPLLQLPVTGWMALRLTERVIRQ